MKLKYLTVLLVLSTCLLAQDKRHETPGPRTFRVVLHNPHGWRHYSVQTATELQGKKTKWKTIFRGDDGANPVTFVDHQTKNYPRKFYRLTREDNKPCDKQKD